MTFRGLDSPLPQKLTAIEEAELAATNAGRRAQPGGWVDPKRCPTCGRAHGFHHDGCPNHA